MEVHRMALGLVLVFAVLGVALVVAGIWIIARMYGKHAVEVEAECVDVAVGTLEMGSSPGEKTCFWKVKRPHYRYYYEGTVYCSQPLLQSNRPGYHPQKGPCTIRINPDHPERVYSSERKFAGGILIVIGSGYLLMLLILALLSR